MANLQTNVPLINTAFVDKNGNVTEAWFLFLIQLWRRTGGSGGDTGSITLDDVFSIEETFSVPPILSADSPMGEMTFSCSETERSLLDMIFAPVATQMVNESFSSGTDFTPGTTTVLTLKETFSSAAQLLVFFDGTFQGDDQYSLTRTTLTFTSAIPVGVNKVYVKGLR